MSYYLIKMSILYFYCLLSILKHKTKIKRLKIDYRYAKDITIAIRYIALSTIGFSTVAVVFSGLTFLSVSYIYFFYLFCLILNRLFCAKI